MKNQIRKPHTVQTVLSLCFIVILSLSSCARKTSFLTSAMVPAAEGTISVKKDKNKNYDIKVKIYNLAEVERLEPPKKVYVLWMENEEGRAKNMGRINSSHELISKTLKASFETVTPFKPTKIYITAEDEANIMTPSSMVVLLSNSIH